VRADTRLFHPDRLRVAHCATRSAECAAEVLLPLDRDKSTNSNSV